MPSLKLAGQTPYTAAQALDAPCTFGWLAASPSRARPHLRGGLEEGPSQRAKSCPAGERAEIFVGGKSTSGDEFTDR